MFVEQPRLHRVWEIISVSFNHIVLALDRKEKGLNVLNMPLKVGARGFVNSRNKGVLDVISSLCKVKDYKKFVGTTGRSA